MAFLAPAIGPLVGWLASEIFGDSGGRYGIRTNIPKGYGDRGGRKRSTRRGQKRKTARRAYVKKRKKRTLPPRRKNGKFRKRKKRK
tara:strand:- start:2340 stop:2597 length:258 start_codon:yes stop_codon:yes gene_type:complete